MQFEPLIRVSWANLNSPAGDVFTGRDHVGQSGPVLGVHSRTSAGGAKPGVAVSLMPECA